MVVGRSSRHLLFGWRLRVPRCRQLLTHNLLQRIVSERLPLVSERLPSLQIPGDLPGGSQPHVQSCRNDFRVRGRSTACHTLERQLARICKLLQDSDCQKQKASASILLRSAMNHSYLPESVYRVVSQKRSVMLISQKVTLKSFRKRQFPHNPGNLFFVLVIVKDTTDLWGGVTSAKRLQKHFV